MQTIKLLIISSNQGVRNSLAKIFNERPGFVVIDQTFTSADASCLRIMQPDVVLYGWSDENVRPAIDNIKKVCPCTLVIVISDLQGIDLILSTFSAGADGFLKTSMLPADIVSAIELMCKGSICFFPRSVREVLTNIRYYNVKKLRSRWDKN